MECSKHQVPWTAISCIVIILLAIITVPGRCSKAGKRQRLGFRPVHFAAVGLPLQDTASSDPSAGRAEAFQINDGNVVGAGTYMLRPDGLDVDLSLKILLKGQGKPGVGGGAEPAVCLVPCEHTAPPTAAPRPPLCPVPCPKTAPPTQGGIGGQLGRPTRVPTGGQGPVNGVTTRAPGAGTSPATRPTAGPATRPPSVTPTSTVSTGTTRKPSVGLPTASPSTGPPVSSSEQEGLNKHNEFRKVHGVPPLTLNAEMSRQAAAYAQQIANQGSLSHASEQERGGDGENLSMGCDKDGQNATEATTNWYNEVCHPGYTFGQSKGTFRTGHFTQVVWKGSKELGIGMANVNKNGLKCTYIVGRYRPAGNMAGDYAENVPQGGFDSSQYCAGVQRRRTLLEHLMPRAKINLQKVSKRMRG